MKPGLRFWDLWPVAVALALFSAFTAMLWFHWWPFTISWHDASDLGGGYNILAALFSGLAFAGLIITILIQTRELRLQREQLVEQRKELAGQRGELARLAESQDLQNYALLMSAYTTADAFDKRNSGGSPSQEFSEAFQYLREYLSAETKRRREGQPRGQI